MVRDLTPRQSAGKRRNAKVHQFSSWQSRGGGCCVCVGVGVRARARARTRGGTGEGEGDNKKEKTYKESRSLESLAVQHSAPKSQDHGWARYVGSDTDTENRRGKKPTATGRVWVWERIVHLQVHYLRNVAMSIPMQPWQYSTRYGDSVGTRGERCSSSTARRTSGGGASGGPGAAGQFFRKFASAEGSRDDGVWEHGSCA